MNGGGKMIDDLKAGKIINLTERGIEFENGWEIQSFHPQECCEEVYADWKALKDTSAMNELFSVYDLDSIQRIDKVGIKIKGYVVPCYNYQNGFYNSDLYYIVINKGKVHSLGDITDCIKDEIF
jgi:hypothetical protein